MTMPNERTRSVLQTREFLSDLQDRTKFPRLPDAVRNEAHRLMRHFPSAWDLDASHRGAPDRWGPVERKDPS